ncbi:MAG: WGR domain-containing protein [Boseongicola sp. SB0670_bin_30]|nr:WGR domain-containing protein [Boseongicola sp. SB0670_bin_30]
MPLVALRGQGSVQARRYSCLHDALQRQRRFYVMNITQTLLGEWCLTRERGRIGSAGGHWMVGCRKTKEETEAALDKLPAQKCPGAAVNTRHTASLSHASAVDFRLECFNRAQNVIAAWRIPDDHLPHT